LTRILFEDREPLYSDIPGGSLRSSYDFFLHFFSELVAANWQPHQNKTIDSTILSNSIFTVLHILSESQTHTDDILKDLCEEAVFVDSWLFPDFTNRFGGLALVLRKECKEEIPKRSDRVPDPLFLFVACTKLFLPALSGPIRQLVGSSSEFIALHQTLKNVENDYSKCVAGGNAKAAAIMEGMLASHRKCLDDAVRVSTLQQCAYLSSAKIRAMIYMLDTLLQSLLAHSQGRFLQFLPALILENALEIASALSIRPVDSPQESQAPTFLYQQPNSRFLLLSITDILATVLNNDKVVLPGLLEHIVVSTRSLVHETTYLRVIESDCTVCRKLIKSIMQISEGKYWLAGVSLLVRCWTNLGFAFAACVKERNSPDDDLSMASSSEPLREALRFNFLEDYAAASSFINKFLNNVNWTISEMDQAMSEAQQGERGPDEPSIQEYLNRYIVLFDLGVVIMCLFEAMATEVPEVFSEGDQADTNLKRALEVSVHLLVRAATNKLLIPVTRENLVHIKSAKPILIMSPIAGTLIALSKLNTKLNGAVHRQMFGMASVQEDTFAYLLGDELNYAHREGVSPSDLESLQAFVHNVIADCRANHEAKKQQHAGQLESMESIGEDDLCFICCSARIDVVFKPCQHKSCKMCIQRYLLNDTKCFFCNAKVESYESFSAQGAESEDAVGGRSVSEMAI
jgi:hypothetical protein